MYKEHTISFQTFFVWALLLILHAWNSSPLRSNLLRLQCTCCTVPTISSWTPLKHQRGIPCWLFVQWERSACRSCKCCQSASSRIIVCTVPTLTWNCALIVSIETRRSLSMKFFIWPINAGVLTSLLLPHLSSSLKDSLASWISYATKKLMLDSCKMLQKQSEVFHTFLCHFFHV